MVDEFELAFQAINTQPKDEYEVAFNELQLSGLVPQARKEQEQLQNLQGIPEAINRTGGLPVGGEPEVKGDEDILAKEVGQTKTFMEGPEGKPIEVRRAQAIDIGGRVIPEPISPDGMSLESRAELIKEAGKIVKMPEGSSLLDFTKMSSERNAKLEKLQQAQQTHEANQIAFLSKMISGKSRTQVSMKTGLGEEQVGGGIPVEKETTLVIPTRREASIARIGDQREFIDKIIGNDKFLDYAASKGIDAPSMMSRMAGQYLGVGESPEKIAALKTNPEVRKLAEEWAMTSPDFTDNASDLFKRAWDGYAGAIGSGVVGPIGLALKEVGLENVGQELINASVYADQQRELGQDPRKVGAAMQFGRDVTSGLGFTASAIVTGSLGNTLRAATGLNSVRAVNVFQKANTLTFGGLNSAWQGYSEAKADGATEEQANKAALLTGLTQAPLELVSPLQKWIGRFDPQQQDRLYKGMYKVATAIAEGTEEALFNEMPQQIVGNLVKQYVYKPNQDIFEGTAYAGGVGGVSGVITSIFTQMIAGKKARAMEKKGDQGGSEETDIDSKADEMADKLAPDAASDLAQKMVSVSSDIDNLKEEIGNDEMGLQAFEEGSQERQNAELVLNEKKSSLDRLQKEFDSLSATPVEKAAPVAEAATPSATIEEAKTKVEQLNTEFDALDENDQAGIDRVNKQIFAEQNKIAELTAIEQGVEPQGTTPTREMGLPPSGRTTTPTRPRMLAGEFYADRPILKAFMSATDKVVGRIPVFSKRAQKLKNAIRTGIANNAGFLAGTNTKVITSEDYGKLTGRKQVAADTGTYRATFLNGQKYLVVPDINQLAGISIKGEQRAASKDAALDQESRAAAKKLEEEVIHLSMFQGIQDEYKAFKNPKLSEQEYVIKRLSDIVKEVKRTNPNALPGVSNAYLNDNSKLLDDMTFSQEFMRMVIQRVRTGQITEDLNAIRQAEQEAFSDKDKGAIISLKNSILNALRVVRDSITRYLGKGTSTKEVEKMKNAINAILDEYGIVKGEANYEFQDYSAAQPKGELKAAPTEVTETEAIPVEPSVSETITPAIEASAGTTPEIAASKVAAEQNNAFDMIRANYGMISDEINRLINLNPKIAEALKKIDVRKENNNSFDGTTIRINKTGKGLAMVEAINHETVHAMLSVALREVPEFQKAINDLRVQVIERSKYDGYKRFRVATTFLKNTVVPSSEFSIFGTQKENETLAQYMARNVTALVAKWNVLEGKTIETMSYPVFETAYAMASNDEFLAHALTSELFRSGLMELTFDDNRTGFQKLIDAIRGLFQKLAPIDKNILDKVMKEVERVIQNPDYNPRPIEGLGRMLAKSEPIIEARAGVTPSGEPMSKRSQTAMGRITNNMVSGLEDMAEMLKPKDNKALKEYQSRATQKDKGYNKALISPYAVAGNLFTSNPFTAANNALNKIFRDNPDIDFFRVAQDMAEMDASAIERAYNISPYEQFNLTVMMYKSMPAVREEVEESNIAPLAREAFNLEALNIEAKLATKAILGARSGSQITQAVYTLRNIVGAGMVIDTYKSNIVYSMGKLAALTKSAFNDVANAVRGDRRKAMDTTFNVQSVFRKAVSMMKMAEKNPEKVRQAIRAEIGKKKNRSTREILLEFASGLFDTKEDKYANMVVDQTVQHILAIGMNKKEFSIDNISKFMYQSFATAARQMGIQQAGIEKQKKGKRSGKYLEMVKAVIGNDNAYKSFLNDLAEKMAEKYPSRKAFNDDFANLFQSLRSNEWADKLRTQAIQDASEYLNYKFADLFTYLGEQRDANQESVKQHIRAELAGTGASRELVDKFIQDADNYLTQETTRILKDKLGFTVDEKTGKVSPKPLLSKKIKEEAESQAKAIKNLKDITKLSATDEGNFKDGLISRIITEVGMPKDQATELANMITDQIEKAMLAQKSENLANALKKAEEVLANNKIKSKTNQRTLLQKLIEMANMGVLDNEKVYEAYRKTHNFEKTFLPYDAEFVNALREWGDRIAKLPDGVIRSIEEEKMGRALMEKTKFTAGDILSSYWYWSLLSSIGTPALNIMSGTSNLVANMITWGFYSPKSIFPMLGAFYNAINGKESAAVNSFLYVMRYGMNPSGIQDERRAIYPKANVLENATKENVPKLVYYLSNFGDGKINFLPSSVNAVLKNISPRQMMRVLKASDMFLREVAFEAKLAQAGGLAYSRQGFDMALRQAELEMQSSKATGKQKRQETLIRAKEIFRKIRSANAKLTEAQIEQDSLETVFNQQPVGVLGSLANMANFLLSKHPSLKFFVPFTNVVANVSNEFINYTPGLSQARWLRARQEGANSPFTEGRSEKEWEIAIKGGVGFLAMVVPLLLQMNISGDEEDEDKRPVVQLYAEGPRDPKQQRIWRQNGGIKYSIRIGNVYLSLLGTPLVIPLAMSTMLTEEVQAIKKKQLKASEVDYFDLALKALSSPFSIAITASLNQSFLAGVGDILGLTNSKDPVKDGQGIINGIVSRMIVPGQLRDVNKVFTNERAVGTGTLSNFLKEMPGSINFLEKDVNYFGDPARFPSIVKEEGLTQRLASLFGRIVSQETPDEGFKIMYDLNLTPPSWDSSFTWPNGKQMTKTQQLDFIRTGGPRMRDWIIENEGDLRNIELTTDQEEKGMSLQQARQDFLSNEIEKIRGEAKKDLEDTLALDFSSM